MICTTACAQRLPVWNYLSGKGTVIGIYGEYDESVLLEEGARQYNKVVDGDDYYYVDAFWQCRIWASDQSCRVRGSSPA